MGVVDFEGVDFAKNRGSMRDEQNVLGVRAQIKF